MSENQSFVKRVLVVVGIVAATVLITWFLISSISVVLMVFASAILAVPITWAANYGRDRFRLPRWFSLTIVVIILIGFLVGLGALAIPTITGQAEELASNLLDSLEEITDFLERFSWGRELVRSVPRPQDLTQGGYSTVVSRALGIFSNTLQAVTWPLLVLLISIYFSAEPRMHIDGLIRLLAPRYRVRAHEVSDQLGHTIRWWLFGQGISMLVLGTGTTVLLWILGIPLAFFMGILTAFMTFIPILGPIIAGIPVVLISLTVSPARALVVGAFYLVLQNIEGSFLTPTIHRKIIAMPPALIISIQIVLASLIGFVGVLLAMPLVACGMVLVRMVYIEDVLERS